MKPIVKLALQIIVVFVVSLTITPTVVAQFGPSTPGTQNSRDSERHRIENERDLENRIFNLRMLSEQARQPGPKRPSVKQALAQMQKDFMQIQILNRDLGRAAIGSNTLDLKFVVKSVSEIKQRAERLNANLALPEPQKPEEKPNLGNAARPEQVKLSILRLVKVVFSFVDNPFFKEINVVDTQQTTKARRDLEEIIELSEQLKKDCEKFDKALRGNN